MPNDIANNMADTIHQLEKELKDLREENKVLTRDCLRLIKANGKLRKKLGQIAEYKRLLKAAVEDLRYLESHTVDEEGGCMISEKGVKINCQDCPLNNNNTVLESKCKWNYEDEALKLIES